MKKRLFRYIGALIVSLVSTHSGFSRYAWADIPACGLSDVSAWQMALEYPAEEATPAYVRKVSEAFIAACPDRPEVAEAHRIAGQSAAYDKDIAGAAQHFDQAGYVTDIETLFLHAAVRAARGETDRASILRNDAIDHWVSRIERRGLADIEVLDADGGQLIGVHFRKTDPETKISDLWIAKPDGAGWPAALKVTADRQLNAFHRLRAGDTATEQSYIRMYRCNARRMLARTSAPVTRAEVRAAAELGLRAYLANPDDAPRGTLQRCLFAEYMLPDISTSNAIPIQ